jgi:hypothetical protein
MGPERGFYEGRQLKKQTERQPKNRSKFDEMNTQMIESVSGARKF